MGGRSSSHARRVEPAVSVATGKVRFVATSAASKPDTTAYVQAINKVLGHGDSTEHSFRPALKSWVESFSADVSATNEPKQAEHNAPDFDVKVQRRHGALSIGKIEAKDVGTDLGKIEKDSERDTPRTVNGNQLKRYRRAFSNLILTDNVEFRWYQNGEPKASASLGAVIGKSLAVARSGAEDCEKLIKAFLDQQPVKITSAKALAERMAAHSAIIQDVLSRALKAGTASKTTLDLKQAFADTLVPDLTDDQFADMFAQTIAYGLFASRVQHRGKAAFTRVSAGATVPKSNPFLRGLFGHITGYSLGDEPFVGIVDDLAQLLNDADIDKVLKNFGKERRDPIVHFYETFLSAYNPELRDIRGVYYTPIQVVEFIVNSVDLLLKDRFGLSEGIADTSRYDDGTHKVLMLDPATGTGTFLYAAIDKVRKEFIAQGRSSMWAGYVRQHLLPRLFGFELMVAPYAIAHIKIALQLAGKDLSQTERGQIGFEFADDERIGVYLTNTLEPGEAKTALPLGKFISDEANAASDVKTDKPIMVVFGNPPYQGHSANASSRREFFRRVKGRDQYRTVDTAIGALLKAYFKVDGEDLKEANSKWLHDDYVKFIRFGQHRIEQTGHGILAYVTNHTFLDAPTFRGMRDSLLSTFDDVYVLDLHGSIRRREENPIGGADHNVFDQIQQGVCITVFVRSDEEPEDGRRRANVHYADLWGTRAAKYEWLGSHTVADTDWATFQPTSPFYSLRPEDAVTRDEWDRAISLPDIFRVYSTGIVTHRDEFAIDTRRPRLAARLEEFLDVKRTDTEVRTKFFGTKSRRAKSAGEDVTYPAGDNRDWRMAEQRAKLQQLSQSERRKLIKPVTHRPFDNRFVIYHKDAIDGLKNEVMRHMREPGNLGLISARSNKSSVQDQFFVTDLMSEVKAGEATTGSVLFPLWLHPAEAPDDGAMIAVPGSTGVKPNISDQMVKLLDDRLGLTLVKDPKAEGDPDELTVSPRDVLDYVYGIVHSRTYRVRYEPFLKSDYPRIPLVPDVETFWKICQLGHELIDLHLLRAGVNAGPATAPTSGNNRVDKIAISQRWVATPEDGSGYLILNVDGAPDGGQQILAGVSEDVWNFQVGGHRVLHKWLDARVGDVLEYDEILHLVRTVNAIHRTVEIMDAIEEELPDWPLA